MEFSIVRCIVSIGLIILGGFYFKWPERSLAILNFNKSESPSKGAIQKQKIGGIIIILLGFYYILVMFDMIP